MAISLPSNPSIAGATLGVSLSMPSAYTTTGFEAVTFTTVKFVISAPVPAENRPSTAINYLDSTSGKAIGVKAVEDLQHVLQADDDDAGQALILANATGNTKIAFELTYVSGRKVWWVGYVHSFAEIGSDNPEGDLRAQYTVSPLFDALTGKCVIRYIP